FSRDQTTANAGDRPAGRRASGHHAQAAHGGAGSASRSPQCLCGTCGRRRRSHLPCRRRRGECAEVEKSLTLTVLGSEGGLCPLGWPAGAARSPLMEKRKRHEKTLSLRRSDHSSCYGFPSFRLRRGENDGSAIITRPEK